MIETRFEMFRDPDRGWRWRFRVTGGPSIAESSRGYEKRGDCLRAIVCVWKSGDARIYEVRPPVLERPAKRRRRTSGRVIDFPAPAKEGVPE